MMIKHVMPEKKNYCLDHEKNVNKLSIICVIFTLKCACVGPLDA